MEEKLQIQDRIRMVRDWIIEHSETVAFAIAVLALCRMFGVDSILKSPQELRSEGTQIFFFLLLPIPDTIGVVLAVCAVMAGREAMKLTGDEWGKGKGAFIIGILCIVLLDETGEPRVMPQTGAVPVLDVSVPVLSPGETAEFETGSYPGVLESD